MAETEEDQMSPAFYSQVGATYQTAFAHDPGLHTYLQSHLLPQLAPNSTILDIGCGTGHPVASTLAAAGHHVTGIDISEEMVRLSRISVPKGKFEVADMQTYQPEGTFGAVLAILSLFPLDREAIETQAARWSSWLPVGGILGIVTIAAEDVEVEGRGGRYDADGMCARGITVRFMGADVQIELFTRKGWEVLLGKEGFEIVGDLTETFVPPEEADSGEEVHYFVVAKKIR
ncbi:hypothetical protein PRZ48_013916 [Zasmidium cellare]|uniref:phosphoethanolamine N-methyltransferase n=1 Tax=Zasmidium cellare TaxID=395010 RepID=A0ABR0DZX1_ZASCE|nr:hypothetical protein PRZ48_013916 [Zasmidium cellare]